MEPPVPSEPSGAPSAAERGLTRVWIFSLVVGVGVVAASFWYLNFSRGHDWVPLGYDTYYYLGYIGQVVASGPLQFAASQHYVEFLYPIVASIPVYLGASADAVEIVLPSLLACATVAAVGFLALESRDRRIAILSVAFASSWFAVYRMGADFQADLLALPFLIIATALLLRVARTRRASLTVIGAFVLLVVIAAAAHVETTDFFIAAWLLAFAVLYWKSGSLRSRHGLVMILGAAIIASPFTVAYFGEAAGGLGGQYCVFPPYWIEVFGPAALLAVLGVGALALKAKSVDSDGYLSGILLTWSALAVGIGVLGYITQFPIDVSDRALLLFPIPLVSSFGTVWMLDHVRALQSYPQTRLLTLLAVLIPLLTLPVVLAYVAPHFSYYSVHGPFVVECSTS